MKIMIDTNVIVSALLFPESIPAEALFEISENHDLVLCDHIIDEVYDVIERKRPDLIAETDLLLAKLSYETVIAPREASKIISDPKDAPILNSATIENVDYLISGDRHFLSLSIEQPKIVAPSTYLQIRETE